MISVVPKFRKQKSPAQSARHQKHKNMLKFRQRSTSVTVHYIFCNVPAASSLGQKKPLRQRRLSPLLPPTALLGEDTHRHCTSIFLICCLTFPSDYSSFITYRSTKVKPFCKKEQVYGFLLTFVRKQAQTVFLRIHSFFCIDNARHPCFLFTHSREYCINYVYNTHIHSFYRNYQSIFLQNSSKFYIVFADFLSDFCLFYLSYFYFSPFSLCNSLKLNNYTYIY